MKSLSPTMTIKEIVATWPETLDVFTGNGFENFSDEKVLESVGRFLKLETALKNKGYAVDTFVTLLSDKIGESSRQVDVTLVEGNDAVGDIDVAGLLPCPVRVPLLEAFDAFTRDYQLRSGYKTASRLEAASVGAQWLDENIRNVTSVADLPDLFISAGFDTFFDPDGIGKYRRQGAFAALDGVGINDDFSGLDLTDPQQDYSIISVVPAVFMVDKLELGDLPMPRTWADLLKPIYARKVALPVGDFDLFNAILLNIYKDFGDDGVKMLANSMLQAMHPAQMVKSAGRVQQAKPMITILPYFFTRMAQAIKSVEIVWPEDGAIISPIFMLVKNTSLEKTLPLAEFMAGEEVGTILAQKGLFPSLHPQVNNVLPDSFSTIPPWKWLGWDFIYANDIAALIVRLENLFNETLAQE